ncbi:MAG: phage holin family protein [Leadbetterella sp.]|nr:phage holin family protein [Leadbetterella sp.]
MINYAIRLVLTGALVYLMPKLFSGITVDTLTTGVIVAFVMSLLNTFVRPLLDLISLPITFLTLGLFSLVISVGVVYLCTYLVDGFQVSGFFTALIFSFLLSIANGIVGSFQD